jgi:tRNA pseudouridine38-40 synthase
MCAAAAMLIGRKDFKSFASAADKRQSSVRTVFHCDVSAENDWVYIDIEGDGFLYNMVRNIVGTLVEVGQGRWKPEKIKEIIKAKDRTAAGPIAPAVGLCLMWVKY